ncbi:hypothetical protein ACN9MB_07400 [Dyella kyungheensis]|uniref:hypothetical protein n=1 Tax=Dyella kyungheensis TaxID=1242174 RepID=UPI003CF11ACC
MANKTIIPIEIDDSSFKAFYELFQQFQEHLGEIPEEWKQINNLASSSHDALAGAAGAILESMIQTKEHARQLALNMKSASEAQKQFRLTTFEGEIGLKKMTTEAKDLAHTLFGIGKFFFQLNGGALLGTVGGLFGMDKLAARAIANQRTARGLGMTTGEYRAFGTDLGRYVDDGMLENIANAKNDLTKQVYLQRASGLSPAQTDHMNPGALAGQLALKAHDWWASTPDSQHNTQFLATTGFGQLGMTMDDIRRSGIADRSELLRGMNQFAQDSRQLNISDRNTDAMYAFYRDLELAGQKLETVFTNRLAELGPTLGGLITTLGKDAEILVNDVFSKENIQALESGIDNLTNFLGSQEFRDDVKAFADGIGAIAKAISDAKSLFSPGGASGSKSGPANDDGTPVAPGTTYWDNPDNYKDSLSNKLLHPGDYLTGKKGEWLYMFPGYSNIAPGMSHHVNNPGNLRAAPGTKTADGFAQFDNVNDGFAAMAALLGGPKYNKHILSDIIGTYAPRKDHNDTDTYIKNVAGWTGFKPNQMIDTSDPETTKRLIAAIVRQENSIRVSPNTVGDDIAASNWNGGGQLSPDARQLLNAITKGQNKPVNVNVTVSNRTGTDVAASANAGGVQ